MKKVTSLFFILLLTFIAGCSHQTAKDSDSGVAAVVNGVEITKRQVDYLYQRSAKPGMSEKESAYLKRQILADLVRTELLVGKAKAMKLDNTPDYTMALYTAQKKVLAGFAEKKFADTRTSISSSQVESVVLNTPQLFSGRKLYVYEMVLFPGIDMPLLESLDALATGGAPLSRIIDELKAKKIPFSKKLIALTSEKIPPQILSILNRIKPETPQIVARKGEKISMILLLRNAYPAPLEGDSARRVAAEMISANQINMAMSKAMSELLDNAKITYHGEYAKTVDGKNNLLALPVPDTKKATKDLYKKIILGSGLSASFILAIMMLTAVMRTFYSMMWLPPLWFGSNNEITNTKRYDIRATATLSRRIYLFGLMVLIAAVLFFEFLVLWNKLTLLVLLGCVAGGIIVGLIASRLLNAGAVRGWTRKTYTVVASALAFCILVGVVITIKVGSSVAAI